MNYFNKEGLDLEDSRMKKIIRSVHLITSKLKFGKKYTLKQMIEIESPGWWENNLPPYDARSAGLTFVNLVLDDYFPNLQVIQKKGSNLYFRVE